MHEAAGDAHAEQAPTMIGRLTASEAVAVAELAPETVPEIEAVLRDEIEALEGLEPEGRLEAEANLRVLLAEHDGPDVEVTDVQHAHLEDAADALRRLTPEGNPLHD